MITKMKSCVKEDIQHEINVIELQYSATVLKIWQK